ncbi:MAG: hypothetical protein JWL84_2895 [Rhodospirillales bacterium]|nr:hypothetical protein [Rhodospirillales bacterium]
MGTKQSKPIVAMLAFALDHSIYPGVLMVRSRPFGLVIGCMILASVASSANAAEDGGLVGRSPATPYGDFVRDARAKSKNTQAWYDASDTVLGFITGSCAHSYDDQVIKQLRDFGITSIQGVAMSAVEKLYESSNAAATAQTA